MVYDKLFYDTLNKAVQNVLGNPEIAIQNAEDFYQYGHQLSSMPELMNQLVNSFLTEFRTFYNVDQSFTNPLSGVVNTEIATGGRAYNYTGILDAVQDNSYNLEAGVNYIDGTFHPVDMGAEYYTDWKPVMYQFSVSNVALRDTIFDINKLGAYLDKCIQSLRNSEVTAEYTKTKELLAGIGADRYANAVSTNVAATGYKLVTIYNLTHTPTVSTQTALSSPDFMRWATAFINGKVRRMQKISKKYNDGSKVIQALNVNKYFLTDFMDAVETATLSYYKDINFVADDVDFWQDDLHPMRVKLNNSTTVNNLVGLVFDSRMIHHVIRPEVMESRRIPEAQFTNYYAHYADAYDVIKQVPCVAFFLE